MNAVVSEALNIVFRFIMPLCNEHNRSAVERCLLSIAGVSEFNFSEQLMFGSYGEVQAILARINERESIRKSKGVFYTPTDVVRFIVGNSIKASFGALTPENIQSLVIAPEMVNSYCFQKTVFEPTCGAGEFLLEALNQKFSLWNQSCSEPTKTQVEQMVGTVYGNDINIDSVVITKLRLFLCAVERYGASYCVDLASILNQNFTTYDYVGSPLSVMGQYDIIVGNPPYVEDRKSGLDLRERYGNIYANVLLNAANHLKPGGSMGFIIPISYSSTPRMKKLRDSLMKIAQEQFILCYADRPDCLFDSVHQKLCILICRNTNRSTEIYTGNYQYWYQEERDSLFSNTRVVHNCLRRDDCIPKLGTPIDLSIFQKVMNPDNQTVFSTSRIGQHSIYVNRREAFWIKAFRKEIIHPEFKVFSYPSQAEADYCYCLVNSSLFWWYWISVSDCWHVSRELNGFRAPVVSDASRFTDLAEALDAKLEITKEYVGTKQTEYEYKHRSCLEEIHAIDDAINSLFDLTEEESIYIKDFALRYRISGGAVGDECN